MVQVRIRTELRYYSNMERDAWLFIGFFVLMFFIWILIGGPTRPLALSGPALPLPGALGGGTYLSLPRAPFSIGNTDVSLPSIGLGSDASGSGYGSNAPVPSSSSLSGVSFGTPSPYRGTITMSHSISGAGSSNPNDEYLTLSVSSNAGVPVDITGWTLESDATGNAAVIPGGTPLPLSGIVNSAADIVLEPGQQAIILSGQSPIGASFQENKCIGYFANFQTFSPALPQSCPSPSTELQTYYGPSYIRDASCIDYVNTLNRCEAVLTPPTTISGACQSFVLKYFNYNGCVQAHQNDADFAGNTWRVYLGRTAPLWRAQHEVVKLLDKQGRTVDAFTY